MNLILCGLPGSGKTTFGSLLAERLSLPFIDTDQLVEEAFGQFSCRQIYRMKGGAFFRRLESTVVQSLRCTEPTIIATGGGTLIDPANTAHLHSLGTIGYLKASGEFLYDGVIRQGMPAYLDAKKPKESFLRLASTRQKFYEKAADFTIKVEQHTPEKILQLLSNIGRHLGK